ncbi:hypothetical protein J2T56_002351 [Natronobacillus azotifigens]
MPKSKTDWFFKRGGNENGQMEYSIYRRKWRVPIVGVYGH